MCLTPIQIKKEKIIQKLKDSYHMQQVPCGRCVECMKLRINSWYVRINEELKVSSSAYFVTMTYLNEPVTPEGEPTLNYKDVQLFMKRLRKCQDEKIRYFIVGEYGSKTGRPHYHALLFNINNIDDVQKCWTHGFIHVGKVQDESIFYTLKYSLKRAVKWKKRQDHDPLPEKALVSQKMGMSFLTKKMIDYYKADPSRSVTMLNNIKLPLPRYYRDKLFTNSEKLIRSKKLLSDDKINKKSELRYKPIFKDRLENLNRKTAKNSKKTD